MPNGKLVAKARKAHEAIRGATRAYHAALAAAYPVGMRTYYSLGEHWVPCKIVGQRGVDFMVRGESSGNEYRVSGYRFHE